MYKFVLKDDFKSIATNVDLNVLSDANDNIINQCNKIAIDEASAYINTKYDLVKLFSDPILYSSALTYSLNDRVYSVGEQYVGESGSTYFSGDTYHHFTCIQSGSTNLFDTNYFVEQDSRDNKLVQVILSISLYYIHQRISPNNIPNFRVVAYDGNGDEKIMSSIKWLTNIQNGNLNPYNWPILTYIDETEPELPIEYDLLGNDPGLGIMFGNDIGDEYFVYGQGHDKNIIKK